MARALKKNYDVILFACGVIAAMAVRYLCRHYESGDFIGCLRPWVEFYKNNGGWYGLKDSVGDYNMIYQYILVVISFFNMDCLYPIKIVSILFDVILALGCAGCLKAIGVDRKKQRLCFLCVLLLPTVFINSAFWAQCDSIYVAFIVWSIYFLMVNKNAWSIAFLALAFSFKLQTVFIMPLYLVAFLNKQFKFSQLLIFPAVFFAIFIPALIMGRPLSELLNIYVNQTTEYPLMVMNAPAAPQLFQTYEPNQTLKIIFIALAGVFTLTAVALAYKKKLYPEKILALALLFVIGIPFLLPHMHDRYFYMADILSVICVFAYGKKYIPVMVLTELASLTCYMHYFGFINMYAGNALSYLLCNTAAAIMMLLAFVLTLLHFLPNLSMKRYAAGTLAALVSAVVVTVSLSGNTINVIVNGKLVSFASIQPYEEQGMFMIPIRNFTYAWGGEVSFNGETGRIELKKDSTVIEVDSGSQIAAVNGQPFKIERFGVAHEASYLSHNDIMNLTGLHCKIKSSTLVFSDTLED